MTRNNWIIPDWPAPDNVRSCSTTRYGGVSLTPYNQMNLGDHVGDDPVAVKKNREQLVKSLELPNEPCWLQQVHGTNVTVFNEQRDGDMQEASVSISKVPVSDASTTSQSKQICAVLTADCLPVLFCDQSGTQVAAAHAGWRGLATGVLEEAVNAFSATSTDIMAWLGPAIGPSAFEVGVEVRDAFLRHSALAADAFEQVDEQHWLADIYGLARQRLQAMGLTRIYGGGYCTVTDRVVDRVSETEGSDVDDNYRFFSFRRDNQTGRMSTLIWFD